MVSIGIIGISHKTAGLALREVVSGAAEFLRGEKALFFRYPTVLLSTCNRIEIYFEADDLGAAHSEILAFLRARIKLTFEHKLYSYFGIDCFYHLCKVTAGLDSAIVAETEIQRQVKFAYANAKNLSKGLHYLFQKGLKVGKNIRSQMQFQAPKLYSTLWQMAEWRNKKILLVGYSEINRGFLSYLLHKGVNDLTLCTRKKMDSKDFKVVGRSILDSWQEYELIVSATAAPEFLIRGKAAAHNIIFDLSVPRSVDPNVGGSLYNIETINQSIKNCEDLRKRYDTIIWENVERLTQIYLQKNQALEIPI